MENYKDMYVTLFRAVTETLGDMEANNYGTAKERLIRAQQQCEEMYIVQKENAEMREYEDI